MAKNLADIFKEIRINLGYRTQQEFADVLEVKRTTISDIERGKTEPRFHLLEKIRRKCGINLNYLVDNKGVIFEENVTMKEPIPQYGNTDKDLRQALEDCRKDKERAWAEVEWLRGQIDEIKKKEAS
jgi:DNA-binding XRE family transcriptional regulator